MKGILGWIKSNLLIVISTVVIVVSLPLGWFFSSGWNKSIRETQEKDGNAAYNQIRGAKVNYVIPSHNPGEESWSESLAPNRAVTELVAAERERRSSAALSVVEEIQSFNRRSHELLANGLLPAPVSRAQEIPLKYEFLVKMAGDQRLGTRTVYSGLLESIGAGEPPDPLKMEATLSDIQQRESERILAETNQGSLEAEQAAELRKLLVDRRVAEVQRRAKEISVYASLASFDPEGFGQGTTARIPPMNRQQREEAGLTEITLDEVFEWNFDYWVVNDLFDAIDLANTTNGVRANVENAVVKRVDGVAVEALRLAPPPADDGGRGRSSAPASEAPAATKTHTDRQSNDAFDVVRARMSVVVDSQRLPELINALAETNLITVVDIDISEVDAWDDLRQGYYYGEEPVVRADLVLETIWLRTWTTQFMPASIRQGLGIADGPESEDG